MGFQGVCVELLESTQIIRWHRVIVETDAFYLGLFFDYDSAALTN